MTFCLWPATRRDIADLASSMRASDIEELTFNARATGRWSPDWTIRGELMAGFDRWEHWAILRDCDVVAVGGIAPKPSDPGVGAIWMLGTDLADQHWRQMTRLCRRWLEIHRPHYRILGNVLPAHMMQRRRWLEHLGFDFIENEAQRSASGHVVFIMRTDGPQA